MRSMAAQKAERGPSVVSFKGSCYQCRKRHLKNHTRPANMLTVQMRLLPPNQQRNTEETTRVAQGYYPVLRNLPLAPPEQRTT